MARRLKTIAKYINSHTNLKAEITIGYCNTDRKVGRLRMPGKGRIGNRIIIFDQDNNELLDHNSAETYRSNQEVEDFLKYYLRKQKGGIR